LAEALTLPPELLEVALQVVTHDRQTTAALSDHEAAVERIKEELRASASRH